MREAKTESSTRSGAGAIKPGEAAKEKLRKPKSADDKGQNIAQNTNNQGYQQDR